MPRPRLAILCALIVLLLAVPAAGATADGIAPRAAAPTPPAVRSGEDLIVEWAPRTDHGERVGARSDAEVSFEEDLGNRRFQLVSVQPGQAASEAVAALENDPAVVVAERDGYRATNALPNDPLLGQLWGLHNLGSGIDGISGAITGDDIDAPTAWDRTVGSPSIVIADIDSGYRFEYTDLDSVAWTNPGEIAANGEDDDGDGIVDDVHGADFIGANGEAPAQDGDPTDEDLISGGHGVHTAGTMGAAGDNGVGITGVAQDVRIMPLRVCSRYPGLSDNRCRISSILAAINYAAAKDARVANMSLGGNEAFQTEVDAIAAAKQTLFVISAGNDSSDNDGAGSAPHGHHYPCDFRPDLQASVSIPEPIDNIVCVAASDQADGLAGFSDWGATSVDLGAPGTETLSAYPFGTRFEEAFTTDDFSTKWTATGTDGGFARTNESPLTSFGITDTVGDPTASTMREVASTPVTIPSNGGCRLNQNRHVSLAAEDQYRYAVLLNGVEQASSTPASSSTGGMEKRFLDLPAAFNAGGELQIKFRFTAGSAPASGSGVWLDDITLVCSEPVGTAASYGYLQGTSMAAPHVSGAAALLFSLEPGASVTEAREALLEGVDAVPSLTGKTTSGGRLNVAKSMEILKSATPQLESTVPASPANDNNPKIRGGGEAGSTIRIYSGTACSGSPIATGSGAALESPGIPVSVPDNSISHFSATAAGAALNESSCSDSIAYAELTPIVDELPQGTVANAEAAIRAASPPATVAQFPKPSCRVPSLTGKTLGQAKTKLRAAHCALGTVIKPKAKRGHRLPPLVVKSTNPAGGSLSSLGKVNLTLGPKPKPKAHHH
jgi:subtilisin family serine protease